MESKLDELKVSDPATWTHIPIQVVPNDNPPHQHPVAALPVSEIRSVEMVDPQHQQPVAGLQDMVCPQTPRCNNQGLSVSKVRLLERVDSAPIIHAVARLPFGPVQLPDAIDYQKVRSWRDHTPEPPVPVVLRPKDTEFSKGNSWWRPDDWKQHGIQAL